MNVEIQIKGVNDPMEPVAGLGDAPDADLTHCFVMQAGTVSGDSVVTLLAKGPHGYYAVPITGKIFHALAGALSGAEQRWLDQSKGN